MVIAGPSGSGKNSIIRGVMGRCSNTEKMVTAATREMREREKEGYDHIFMTNEEFLVHKDQGLIPEFQYVADRDIYYGTYLPKLESQLAEGSVLLSEIQIIGAKYLKENFDALTIFIQPDSFEVLEQRIRNRSQLSESEIESRINIAKREVEEDADWYDHTIKNSEGKLEEAIEQVLQIMKQEGVICVCE